MTQKEKRMFEGQLGKDMMIEQGYVPAGCTMDPKIAGPLIYSEINAGRVPCAGCAEDVATCKGPLPTTERRGK